jgi:3-oxoacyl-[acyl-carrier-protein] synthase-3
MESMSKISTKIQDIAIYLPNQVLSNEDLERLYPDWPSEKIFQKTGIKERRVAGEAETASDLAYQAAINLFTQGNVGKEDVDFIILCTQAPDYILPTTACILQDRLGIPKECGALDINLGCSGFVYGLSLAKGLIETKAAKCILLLTADTYSKYIHPMDKSVRTIFGDGATASLITSETTDSELIGPFVFGTDGSGAKHLVVEGGMFRTPLSASTSLAVEDTSGNIRSRDNLYMNGAEVMAFSLKAVPNAIETLLDKASKSYNDIDIFVLHQANKFMLEALRKKIKVSAEKLPILIEDCGNTVSSSIPIALYKLRDQGRMVEKQSLMLVGFGVGYSWAACIVNI